MELDHPKNVIKTKIPPLNESILSSQISKISFSASIDNSFNRIRPNLRPPLLPPPPPPPLPLTIKQKNLISLLENQLEIKPKRPPPPPPTQIEDENLIYGNVLMETPTLPKNPPLPKHSPTVRSSVAQQALVSQDIFQIDKRLSTDKLSLNDVKRILVGKFSDYEFENEKLEKILIRLPRSEYLYYNDWLNAFSIKEIRINFYTNVDDLYILTIEDLKKRISKVY